MKFTARAIESLKGRETRYEVFEAGSRGFGVRVAPSGAKSWITVYRRGGKLARVTLGAYPAMPLAQARALHAEHRANLHKGVDPAGELREQRKREMTDPTVADLVVLYLTRWAKPRKKSWKEDERQLRKDVVPAWGWRKARDIRRSDVVVLLDEVVDRGAEVAANRLLAVVRRMFAFAVERSILEASPCTHVKAPGKETRSDRVLTEDEIRALWMLPGLSQQVSLALRLMLATAQRKGEALAARWDEIEGAWWTIPAERAKNRQAHRVPLSRLTLALLADIRDAAGPADWLFPSPLGDHPLHGESINTALVRALDAAGLPRFTPHDLRRTAASLLTGMGISRLVVGKILNHVEPGVTAVYDRHGYDAEKRRALESWGRRLEEIVSGKASDKVVRIS